MLAGFLALAGAFILALTIVSIMRSEGAYRRACIVTAGVGLGLVSVITAHGLTSGAFDWEPAVPDTIDLGASAPGPSIHLLLLDGYPRSDALASIGYDNTEFIDAMADLGFSTYPTSRSNYDRTAFTLISMLWMRHLDDIDWLWGDFPPTTIGQTRRAARALLDTPVLSALGSIGYKTRVIRAPMAHVPIGRADTDATVATANNFELVVLQRTPLAAVLEAFDVAGAQQRTQVRAALDEFASPPPDPTFSLAHVLAPHAPYVFAVDGTAGDVPPCYPQACAFFDNDPDSLGWTQAEYRAHFLGHLETVNRMVVDAVARLCAIDPDAVIVVFSDHGAAWIEGSGTPWANLLMVRSPGYQRLLSSSPTLINVLPSILNAYLDAELPMLPDHVYRSGNDPWLDVQRIAN